MAPADPSSTTHSQHQERACQEAFMQPSPFPCLSPRGLLRAKLHSRLVQVLCRPDNPRIRRDNAPDTCMEKVTGELWDDMLPVSIPPRVV